MFELQYNLSQHYHTRAKLTQLEPKRNVVGLQWFWLRGKKHAVVLEGGPGMVVGEWGGLGLVVCARVGGGRGGGEGVGVDTAGWVGGWWVVGGGVLES